MWTPFQAPGTQKRGPRKWRGESGITGKRGGLGQNRGESGRLIRTMETSPLCAPDPHLHSPPDPLAQVLPGSSLPAGSSWSEVSQMLPLSWARRPTSIPTACRRLWTRPRGRFTSTMPPSPTPSPTCCQGDVSRSNHGPTRLSLKYSGSSKPQRVASSIHSHRVPSSRCSPPSQPLSVFLAVTAPLHPGQPSGAPDPPSVLQTCLVFDAGTRSPASSTLSLTGGLGEVYVFLQAGSPGPPGAA